MGTEDERVPVEKPRFGFGQAYPLAKWAAAGYLVFAILVGLTDILHILHHYARYPFGDYWIWLARLYERGPLLAVYGQINEHRLAIPGIFYLLDHWYFGALNGFLIVISALVEIGCIVLLVLPLWHETIVLKPVRYVFAGFAIITMLWFIEGENLYYPFSFCLACANLGILAALYLFGHIHYGARRLHVAWNWVALIVCGVWATFSYGHGMLIWPTLLVAAVAYRLPRRSMLIVAGAFVCVAGLYFFRYTTPGEHGSPLDSLRHPLRLIQYTVIMIGLPLFGAGSQDVAVLHRLGSYAVSAAGILVALAMLAHFAFMKTMDRIKGQGIYCSIIVLTLGSALVTALSRSRFPLDQALSGRYAPVPLLFWISLAGLTTIYLSRWEAHGGFGRAIWCALLMAASVGTLSTQFVMGRYFASRERDQAAAAMSISVAVPDLPRIQEDLAVFPLVSFVDSKAAKHLGHSMFARPEMALLGSPLLQHFQLASAGACSGVVDSAETFPKPVATGIRLAGWAFDAAGHEAERVWVADDRMIIRGLGVTHFSRPDVVSAVGNGASGTAGWVAYAKLPDPPVEVTVFADFGDGKPVCRIGGPRKPAE